MATDSPRADLSPAEIAKLEAEAASIHAARIRDDEKARLEGAKLRAEIIKIEAEAKAAAMSAEQAQINAEREREKRADELATDKFHHRYLFSSSVDANSARQCMAQLQAWHRQEPKCDMEIVFSSPGGSVIDGLALFDFIQQLRAQKHKITTGTLGYAASMAGILLQAGDVRWMGREAYILIHEVSFGASGKIGEVEDEVAFVHKIQGRVLDIFAARSKLSRKTIASRWRRKDWWLDSTEAMKLGFVDQVR